MIGIIILNYINWDETAKCIESIFKTEKRSNFHIYVIDNASPIKPKEEIKQILNHSKITFIQKPKNNGYSGGNNAGVKQAIIDGCEEILISNSDILFTENSIYNMYKYLQENKEVGIVGPKVYLPNGDLQMINMVIKTGIKEKYMYLLRKTILSPFVRNFLKQFCALEQDLTKPFEVHSVSGCCFMMSKSCVEVITPFDENTFLYQEELIIGVRMEQEGYKTVYLPYSQVIHAHGQSTKHLKAFSYTCLVDSELYYFKRYIKSPVIALLPLYLIRTSKYIIWSIKYKDFRSNLGKYFKTTIKRLFQGY